MANRYARGTRGALRVILPSGQEREVTYHQLVRQKRSLVAQREREVARLDAELAETDDMLEACQAMELTSANAEVAETGLVGIVAVELPKPSRWKRLKAILTKPRGWGQ